jgi:spore coat protein H
MRTLIAGFWVIGIAVVSCVTKQKPPLDSYGLTLVHIKMDSEQRSKLNSTAWEKTPVPATIEIGGKPYRGTLSYAGKSTIDDLKKSYNLYFDDQKYRGRTSYRLSAQSLDKSMLLTKLSYDLYSALGLDVPETEFAALYINDQYWGLFYLIEPINEEYFDKRGVKVSSIYQAHYGNAQFTANNLTNIEEAFEAEMEPKSFVDLQGLIQSLNKESFNTQTFDIEKIVNVDNYITYLVGSAMLNNWDGYDNNFFLYREVKSKQFNFLPWDMDRSYDGSHPYEADKTLWGKNKLTETVLKSKKNRDRYLHLVFKASTEIYPLSKMTKSLDSFAQLIAPAYEADRFLSSKHSLDAEKEKLKTTIGNWYGSMLTELRVLGFR